MTVGGGGDGGGAKRERADNVLVHSFNTPCTCSVSHVIMYVRHVIQILAKSGSHSKFYILYLIDVICAIRPSFSNPLCVDSTSIRLHSKDTLDLLKVSLHSHPNQAQTKLLTI